ncbi:MAG: ribonuclease R [Pseudomonadota bacterium]
MTNKTGASTRGFPSKSEITAFIARAEGKVTRRELARAFHLKGDDRARLKAVLRELAAEGAIAKSHGKALHSPEALPRVSVVTVIHVSEAGTLYGRAEAWRGDGDGPKIRIEEERGHPRGKRRPAALGVGERVLARLTPVAKGYKAKIIKRLDKEVETILGLFRSDGDGGRVEPVDKRAKSLLMVAPADMGEAQDGELVRVKPLAPHRRHFGPPQARVIERLGDILAPRSISLIAIHQHGIPHEFAAAALREATAARPVGLAGREDLRALPLVTIDPEDARDHDDAVWAEADPDPDNAGGWHVIVAIADVAHYVLPGSALDKAAWERGNSCYFPDRVVPMLPEALSADLCSLKAGKPRPSLAAHLHFSKDGRLKKHRFSRAVIRCRANLAYHDVQAAVDGRPADEAGALKDDVLAPLYAAYGAVKRAREKRQPLALDLPERRVALDDQGEIAAVTLRERLDAHRLIEDFMIAANVAAAQTLERERSPLIYRVHEAPSAEKVDALRDYLESLGLRLAKGQVIRPALFNRVLEMARDHDFAEGVNDMVLRTQMQAYYSPDNLGHFGLALGRYAHFTSPIRRYADLIVHRALIRALGLGEDGLTDHEVARLADTAEHISATERRAMTAERDSLDRYMAAYYARHKEEAFEGRITGVTRYGLFVRLSPLGGDGFVPAGQLGDDYFRHDEARHALIGEVTGAAYRLGDMVSARVLQAEPVSGALRLALLGEAPGRMDHAPRRARAAKGGRQASQRKPGGDKRQGRRRRR